MPPRHKEYRHLWDVVYLNADRDSEHLWVSTISPYGVQARKKAAEILGLMGFKARVDSAFYRGVVYS